MTPIISPMPAAFLANAIALGAAGPFGQNTDAAILAIRASLEGCGDISEGDGLALHATIGGYFGALADGPKTNLRRAIAGIVGNSPALMSDILSRSDLLSLLRNAGRFADTMLGLPPKSSRCVPARAQIFAGGSSSVSRGSGRQDAAGGAGSNPMDKRRRMLEAQHEFSKTLLRTLSDDDLNALDCALSDTPLRAELTVQTLKAVHEKSPGLEKKLIDIMAAYKVGALPILRSFLRAMDEFDPFMAARAAKIEILPVGNLPEGAKALDEDEAPEAEDVQGGRSLQTVVGASGHKLVGMIHCACNRSSPASTVGFFSKRRAIVRIMAAFFPEKYDAPKLAEVKERRKRRFREIDASLTLADVLASPDLADELGSLLIARDLELYKELRAAIDAHREGLDELAYGRDIVLGVIKSLNVRSDPGGQVLTQYARWIGEGREIPAGVWAAVELLKDEHVDLTPEEELSLVRIVMADYRLRQYINKNVALSGAIADIEAYESLPSDDPLRRIDGIAEAKREIQRAAGGADEMTYADFGKIVGLPSLMRFRLEMNRRIAEKFGTDFEDAIKKFLFLVFERDGAVREDCLEDSAPMNRLKKTLYGAKIGSSRKGGGITVAALGQPDFKHIIDAELLRKISPPDRFFMSMPVAEFRKMAEGVVLAYRKARFLDSRLAEYQRARERSGLQRIEFDPENAGDALAEWRPILASGQNWRFAEDFMADESARGQRLPLGELGKRIRVRSPSKMVRIVSNRREIADQAEAGLFAPKLEGDLKKAHALLYNLVPASANRETLDAVRKILASPFVWEMGSIYGLILGWEYHTRAEVLQLKEIAKFEQRFDELGLGDEAVIAELGPEWGRVKEWRLYDGEIAESGGARRLSLKVEYPAGTLPKVGLLNYIEPAAIRSVLSRVEEGYVPATTLADECFRKLRFLCSRAARSVLSSRGLGFVDNVTYGIARRLQKSADIYISRALVEEVENL